MPSRGWALHKSQSTPEQAWCRWGLFVSSFFPSFVGLFIAPHELGHHVTAVSPHLVSTLLFHRCVFIWYTNLRRLRHGVRDDWLFIVPYCYVGADWYMWTVCSACHYLLEFFWFAFDSFSAKHSTYWRWTCSLSISMDWHTNTGLGWRWRGLGGGFRFGFVFLF